MEAVSGVAGVQDEGVGVVAVVLDLVAVVGNPRLLAANQVKTYSRELRENKRACRFSASCRGSREGGQWKWWVKGRGGRGVTSPRKSRSASPQLQTRRAGSRGCTSGETCSGNGHCHYSPGVEMCFPLGKRAGEAASYYFPSDANTRQSSGGEQQFSEDNKK